MRLFLRLENEQKSSAIWVYSFLEIALTSYLCFDSWEHLLDFMLEGWSYNPKAQLFDPQSRK